MESDPAPTIIEPEEFLRVVLFAAGRGGDPARHLPLLKALARRGCAIIAPRFPPMSSVVPRKAELDARIARLEAALDRHAATARPVVGIGHSIGTVALLALAGAEGETAAGERLASSSAPRLDRVALFAPPTGFFRRPEALRRVRGPIRAWAGANDPVAPPGHALLLRSLLAERVTVEVSVDAEAGHFTFMDEPPPGAPEPHPDRAAFLAALADEVAAFVLAER